MNTADVIRLLGEPDEILHVGNDRMKSRAWFCNACAKIHTFTEPVAIPAPCDCGGICFERRAHTQGPKHE